MSQPLKIVPTKAMLLKKNAEADFKVVEFTSKRPAKTKQQLIDHKLKALKRKLNIKDDETAFDIKKARHEILNFGISGMDGLDKQQAKIKMAVKLGAKPPKNEYKNYKDVLSEKKKRDLEAKESEIFFKKMHQTSIGKNVKSRNSFKKKNSNSVGNMTKNYGVVNPKIGTKNKRR